MSAPTICGRCGSADLEISTGIVCFGRRQGCERVISGRCRACGAIYVGGGEWLSQGQAQAAGRPLVEQQELPL